MVRVRWLLSAWLKEQPHDYVSKQHHPWLTETNINHKQSEMRNLQTLKYAVGICTSCGDFYFLKHPLKDYLTIIITFPDVWAPLRISILQLTGKPSRDNGENEIKSKKKFVFCWLMCSVDYNRVQKNPMDILNAAQLPRSRSSTLWTCAVKMNRVNAPSKTWAVSLSTLQFDWHCLSQAMNSTVCSTDLFFPTPPATPELCTRDISNNFSQ